LIELLGVSFDSVLSKDANGEVFSFNLTVFFSTDIDKRIAFSIFSFIFTYISYFLNLISSLVRPLSEELKLKLLDFSLSSPLSPDYSVLIFFLTLTAANASASYSSLSYSSISFVSLAIFLVNRL